MKKPVLILTTITLFLISFSLPLLSWEPYDRVIAIVNTIPITESDVSVKMDQLLKLKQIKEKNYIYEKSRVIDQFIENVLVNETAEEQSIFVTNKKIMGHIENIVRQFISTRAENPKELDRLSSQISLKILDKLNAEKSKTDKELDILTNDFIEYIENTRKIDFYTFIEEIRVQMKKEQIMQIAIGISPPTKQETESWYKKNRTKLGFEINVKHILVRPKNRSLPAEREANKKIEGLLARIRRGESFEKIAVTYSEDRASAVNGGSIGWVNIATLDPYFAGTVFNMKRNGEISRVFKSGFGYHVVKYIGRRDIKFESVERMIIMKLYSDKMGEQFKKWVQQRKDKSAIKIFMKNYINQG